MDGLKLLCPGKGESKDTAAPNSPLHSGKLSAGNSLIPLFLRCSHPVDHKLFSPLSRAQDNAAVTAATGDLFAKDIPTCR